MIQAFIVYDIEGRIIRTGVCDASLVDLQAKQGEAVMPGTADATQNYVDVLLQQVMLKPVLPAQADRVSLPADGVSVVTIAPLPVPTEVTILGPILDIVSVTDGRLDLTFDTPGHYRITLSAFPYVNKEIVIDAT